MHHDSSQVLNEEKCLGATLDALKSAVEGGRQLEVIVVDGGSTDKCVCLCVYMYVYGCGESRAMVGLLLDCWQLVLQHTHTSTCLCFPLSLMRHAFTHVTPTPTPHTCTLQHGGCGAAGWRVRCHAMCRTRQGFPDECRRTSGDRRCVGVSSCRHTTAK
jgi:hypothetical protein